jgi:hypothetical protein
MVMEAAEDRVWMNDSNPLNRASDRSKSRPVGGTGHVEQKNWPCEYVMTVL